MIIFILVINFLFWNNYRFKRNCKEQCRRRSHIAIAQSPPVVTSCITIRQYQTRKSTMVLSTELISAVLPALSCVCMCECVCAYTTTIKNNPQHCESVMLPPCWNLSMASHPFRTHSSSHPSTFSASLQTPHCCLVGPRRPSELWHLPLLPSGLLVLASSLLCPFSSFRSQPAGLSRWLLAMSQ